MEVLQSPWIPETCFRHLLIFSSAKYNYMIWEMVEKKASQRFENWASKQDLYFRESRGASVGCQKICPRLGFINFIRSFTP